MLFPFGMSVGRSGVVRPVGRLGYQRFRKALSELIRPVRLFICGEFLRRSLDVCVAVRVIQALFEFSAVSQSTHFFAPFENRQCAVVEIWSNMRKLGESDLS